MGFKTFETYLKENMGIVLEHKDGVINGSEFDKHDIPMVVRCTGCQMTMVVTSATIDDKTGETFCPSCSEEIKN
jgi:Zn finger protein HypA/HybF involved in hydrogenase expression